MNDQSNQNERITKKSSKSASTKTIHVLIIIKQLIKTINNDNRTKKRRTYKGNQWRR